MEDEQYILDELNYALSHPELFSISLHDDGSISIFAHGDSTAINTFSLEDRTFFIGLTSRDEEPDQRHTLH